MTIRKILFLLAVATLIVATVSVISFLHQTMETRLEPYAEFVIAFLLALILTTLIWIIARWPNKLPPRYAISLPEWFAISSFFWLIVIFVLPLSHPRGSSLALLFALFSACYNRFPRLTGRQLNNMLGRIHFWITFVGTLLILFPIPYSPMEILPGHHIVYFSTEDMPSKRDVMRPFIKSISWGILATQLLFPVNILYSLLRRDK